ncbi:MAG: hypothetical protein R3C14_45905 [Caldilineaceae bacterium]
MWAITYSIESILPQFQDIMTFTVREFEDLITILNEQPEWRSRLAKALFPEIDVTKALQEIAETTKAMQAMIVRMDARLAKLEQGQAKLEQDVNALKYDVRILKADVRDLKGQSLENRYRVMATGLLGSYMMSGHDATNEVADQLNAALEAGTISEGDVTQVWASDLLWGGEHRKAKEPIVIVMEASWWVEAHDVERAATRSAILRQIGIKAIGVVGGKEWSSDAVSLAEKLHVATTTNGRIDRTSWALAVEHLF